MLTFFLILFILSCIILILSVLLQSGRGGIGEIFGGSGEHALFGGTGAKGFIVKATIGAAAVFMATSLILSVIYSRQARFRPVPQVPAGPVAPSGGATEGATIPVPVEAR